MPLSLMGLASGIDTGSLVDSLVSVARQPIADLEKRKASIDSAAQVVTSLVGRLSALKTAALALTTSTGFASFAATSSDAAVVATATGSSNPGSFSVSVASLARAQKSRSQTFASSGAALGAAGSIAIKVGGDADVVVAIGANDTLADVATKISASGARVTASVISDGTTYRLLVQGKSTGAASSFTLTESGTSLGFALPGANYETAADASFTVDGLPMTSATNQVTGVIPGVKLALVKPTTSAATVQVASDTAALKSKINAFVTAYNDFVNAGHAAAGFGSTKASNALLAADSSVRTALSRVGKLMSREVPGASGAYRTFRSIGVVGKSDGTISFDATKFEAAMAADPDSVRRLFVTDTTTGASGLMATVMSTVDGLLVGAGAPIQSRIDTLNAQSKRLADSKTKMETRLTQYQEQLKKQFTAMDTAVSRYQAMSSAVTNISKNTTSTE